MRSLNQTFAAELGKYKINCNVYCPSPVDTQMWTQIDQDLMNGAGKPAGSLTAQVSSCLVSYTVHMWRQEHSDVI